MSGRDISLSNLKKSKATKNLGEFPPPLLFQGDDSSDEELDVEDSDGPSLGSPEIAEIVAKARALLKSTVNSANVANNAGVTKQVSPVPQNAASPTANKSPTAAAQEESPTAVSLAQLNSSKLDKEKSSRSISEDGIELSSPRSASRSTPISMRSARPTSQTSPLSESKMAKDKMGSPASIFKRLQAAPIHELTGAAPAFTERKTPLQQPSPVTHQSIIKAMDSYQEKKTCEAQDQIKRRKAEQMQRKLSKAQQPNHQWWLRTEVEQDAGMFEFDEEGIARREAENPALTVEKPLAAKK